MCPAGRVSRSTSAPLGGRIRSNGTSSKAVTAHNLPLPIWAGWQRKGGVAGRTYQRHPRSHRGLRHGAERFLVCREPTLARLGGGVAAARRTRRPRAYSTTGVGGTGHSGRETVCRALDIFLTYVTDRGTAPLMQDGIGGRVPLLAHGMAGAVGSYQTGQIRPLAMLGPKCALELSEVPTMAELGHPVPDSNLWFGIMATAGTSVALVTRLARHLEALARSPLRRRYRTLMDSKSSPREALWPTNGRLLGTSTPTECRSYLANSRLCARVKWKNLNLASSAVPLAELRHVAGRGCQHL
ncbi:tripartite tricarboxylate transporter substrate-binding protein [Belnapia sp. F-4-1]|uniref:tripartite tricarboxylate transporter substrate-binding protein n=1 Tax=Belnapia sp. F-4-1 TaxID=1545443 RepID=UPI0009DDF1F4